MWSSAGDVLVVSSAILCVSISCSILNFSSGHSSMMKLNLSFVRCAKTTNVFARTHADRSVSISKAASPFYV